MALNIDWITLTAVLRSSRYAGEMFSCGSLESGEGVAITMWTGVPVGRTSVVGGAEVIELLAAWEVSEIGGKMVTATGDGKVNCDPGAAIWKEQPASIAAAAHKLRIRNHLRIFKSSLSFTLFIFTYLALPCT
jgi:hypothetical protein